MKQLILGGARSGKSALAERLATALAQPVVYLATATAQDDEMARRIAQHQQRRPKEWSLVEAPIKLAAALEAHAAPGQTLLVDCLTLWLTNLLLLEEGKYFQPQRDALLDILPDLPGEILMVSNEVGLGIVPMGEISRRFQDESGWLHQQVAEVCDRVILTVAGLPHVLKG
jgi:adenosylcobinamide kinase/adenosylcobinamide-phosphate guanylyltransferase